MEFNRYPLIFPSFEQIMEQNNILARGQGRKKEKTMSNNIIGIDVSQEKLDVYFMMNNEYLVIDNTLKSIKKFVKLIKKNKTDLVVFEPTNVYHRQLQVILEAEAIEYALVDSYCVKRHKDSLRKTIKTDKQDAYFLADYAKRHEIKPSKLSHKMLHIMQELMNKYNELIDIRVQMQNRDKVNQVKVSHQINKTLIETINKNIDKILTEMAKIIKDDEGLTNKYTIMTSVPGIGEITAYSLLAFMFEIGSLNQRQIARLAGLAPMDNQSGKFTGKKFIGGGRCKVRKALYMPTFNAVRKIDFIKNTNDKIALNKPKKLAHTACMRKLLLLVNTLVKENRIFDKNY